MEQKKRFRTKNLLPEWLKKILKLFGVHIHNFYYFEIDLNAPIKKIKPLITLDIKIASYNEIKQIMAQLDEKSNEKRAHASILHALKNRHTCFIAIQKGEIMGYTWINKKGIEFNYHTIKHFREKGAYSYNSFVFHQYRGKKVFQCLIEAVHEYLKEQGYDFVSNLVNVNNIASIKARRKFGENTQRLIVITLPFFSPILIGKKIGTGQLCLKRRRYIPKNGV